MAVSDNPKPPIKTRRKSMSVLIDFSGSDWKKKVNSIAPTSGYCVFIDIVGSTAVKDKPFSKWLAFFHNNISLGLSSFLHFQSLYKILGDGILIWISQAKMSQSGESALTILDFLHKIAHENDSKYFLKSKISVTFCKSVYEISFDPDKEDIYGQEIDLCFRLNQFAEGREIIMNDGFYKSLMAHFNKIGNKEQFPYIRKIQGPWTTKIKGVNKKQQIFKLT